MLRLWGYENGPGSVGAVPATWPVESVVSPAPDVHDLVVLVHPRCPCSRASLEELDRLVASCGERLAVHVLLYRPGDEESGWTRGDLRARAEAIPGVTCLEDPDGREAERFGARTSGHVSLYDPAGRLAFSGGITGSRGHAGDNAGRRAIAAIVDGRRTADAATPVFGCPLRGRDGLR